MMILYQISLNLAKKIANNFGKSVKELKHNVHIAKVVQFDKLPQSFRMKWNEKRIEVALSAAAKDKQGNTNAIRNGLLLQMQVTKKKLVNVQKNLIRNLQRSGRTEWDERSVVSKRSGSEWDNSQERFIIYCVSAHKEDTMWVSSSWSTFTVRLLKNRVGMLPGICITIYWPAKSNGFKLMATSRMQWVLPYFFLFRYFVSQFNESVALCLFTFEISLFHLQMQLSYFAVLMESRDNKYSSRWLSTTFLFRLS